MSSIKHERFPLKKQKSLLLEMIRTDFKLRYQASALGYVWSILKPLFTFAILYVIFALVLKLGAREQNYALSLLLGVVLWSFFAEATSAALVSIVSSGNLIRKIDIPRYLIPIAATAAAFINLFLNLIVFAVFLMLGSNLALGWDTLWAIPLLILELLVLSLGFGFFFSALYVKLRDINYIWEVVRQALFYAIPIIYPLSRIKEVEIQKILLMNPLTQIIQDARSVTTFGKIGRIPTVFGSWWYELIPIAFVIFSLLIGIWYFNKHSKYFAEEL